MLISFEPGYGGRATLEAIAKSFSLAPAVSHVGGGATVWLIVGGGVGIIAAT